MHGWALARGGAPARVGLFAPAGLLLAATADGDRPDVAAAGLGDGRCGFHLELSDELCRLIGEQGGRVAVRLLEGAGSEIGSWELPAALNPYPAAPAAPLARNRRENCRRALGRDLAALERLLGPQAPAAPPPPRSTVL